MQITEDVSGLKYCIADVRILQWVNHARTPATHETKYFSIFRLRVGIQDVQGSSWDGRPRSCPGFESLLFIILRLGVQTVLCCVLGTWFERAAVRSLSQCQSSAADFSYPQGGCREIHRRERGRERESVEALTMSMI